MSSKAPSANFENRSGDKVRRLRKRIAEAAAVNRDDPVPGILAGLLDLISDELELEKR